jgi:methylmalonyl-CoA carboxyltransferase large subunit
MSTKKIDELRKKRTELYNGGGEDKIQKQHDAGKFTARERLALLFEADTFQEMHLFMKHRCTHFGMAGKEMPGEGVITGHGIVEGRPVYVASQDFTVAGGSVGEATAKKICEVMDQALKTGDPFIFINDSGGARIQEGVDALSGYGGIFYRNVELSGVVPQISIIAGPCAGGAAYSPALTDFIIQVRHEGQMYITGPQVIKEVTGEEISAEQLGGVESHAYYSGVVHFIAEGGTEAINIAKRLLSFLPSNNTEDPPFYPEFHQPVIGFNETLNSIVPENPREPYDMHDVIANVVDQGDFLEIQEHFAPNILIGFARLSGRTVGIVANQPLDRAGVLDIDSSDKASRFIRFCNAFNIPIITFVDVPGFLPGIQQEYGGIIRHGAKMIFAYAAATVPKLTVIVRKAYGGAYLAMCSKDMGADRVCAWPSAEIAVMGAEGAVNVLYRKEIAAAEKPPEERIKRTTEYRETFANPYTAAARGYLDEIIEPADTRAYLAVSLEVLRSKRELRPQKKHGLIPL